MSHQTTSSTTYGVRGVDDPLEMVTQTRRPSIFHDSINEFFGSTEDISTQSCSSSDTDYLITLSSPSSPDTYSNSTPEPNAELPEDDFMEAEDAQQSTANMETFLETDRLDINESPNCDLEPIYRNFYPPNGPVSPAHPMDYENLPTESSDSDNDDVRTSSQPHSLSDTDESSPNNHTDSNPSAILVQTQTIPLIREQMKGIIIGRARRILGAYRRTGKIDIIHCAKILRQLAPILVEQEIMDMDRIKNMVKNGIISALARDIRELRRDINTPYGYP